MISCQRRRSTAPPPGLPPTTCGFAQRSTKQQTGKQAQNRRSLYVRRRTQNIGGMAVEALARLRLHQKKPLEVRVPDLLWKDRGLTEGARYLWCYLWMLRDICSRFTFAELRQGTGLSQHSLLRHLNVAGPQGLAEVLPLRPHRGGASPLAEVLPVDCAGRRPAARSQPSARRQVGVGCHPPPGPAVQLCDADEAHRVFA